MSNTKRSSKRRPEAEAPERLRNVLREQVDQLTGRALSSGAQVSEQQLESIERVSRLLSLREALQPHPSAKRWPAAALLTMTLVFMSILLFARVHHTEITLELKASEIGFSVSEVQAVTGRTLLAALGASGLTDIRIPRTRASSAEVIRVSEGPGAAVLITAVSKGPRNGSVTLAPLILPAGTRVGLRPSGLPYQYDLMLAVTGVSIQADVNGPIQLEIPGRLTQELDFSAPKSIAAQTASGELVLDLQFSGATPRFMSEQLRANTLTFSRVEQHLDTELSAVRPLSTILSGTLYFESLNGEKQNLRRGERLRFKSSEGEILAIATQDDHVDLTFHGRVQGMSTGSGEGTRSLMPTYLEWLRARHGLSLLWGTSVYIFGLTLGVLRWWRSPG